MVSLVESIAQTAKIHTKVIWCKFSVDYTMYLVLVQILERPKTCSNVHPKETCGKGTASFPVPGNAKYDVMITKDGYEDYYKKLVSSLIWISVSRNYFQDVFCNLGVPCSDCKPMLEVNLVEVTSTIIINIINKLTQYLFLFAGFHIQSQVLGSDNSCDFIEYRVSQKRHLQMTECCWNHSTTALSAVVGTPTDNLNQTPTRFFLD